MSATLRAVAELVRGESGIRLGEHQYPALRAAIGRAMPGTLPREFLPLAQDPARGAACLERLIDEVSVQESSFLREREPLERLRWPELLLRAEACGSAVVRVWVAGCANGEEAYTLAMLACEGFGHGHPPVSILATDVSRRALARAREGEFRERALRELSAERRSLWLRAAGNGRMVVRDELKRLVHFRRHNLVTEPTPPVGESPFQLVACRNVLIYFEPSLAHDVSSRLETALAPGGELLLGAADSVAIATANDGVEFTAPDALLPATTASEPSRDALLARARAAARSGNTREALAQVDVLVERDPLDAGAHALRGMVELAAGDADGATVSLRRALYAEPNLGPAAFMLGCAHDAAGRTADALAAYARALDTLGPVDDRHATVFGDLDLTTALAGCRARIEGIRP